MSAVYCTGESSFEVKIEADSNDITEHPHDDKPAIESSGQSMAGSWNYVIMHCTLSITP